MPGAVKTDMPNSKVDDIDVCFPQGQDRKSKYSLEKNGILYGLQYASIIDGDYYETVLLTFASYFSMPSLLSKLFLNMENIDIAS